MAPINTSKNQLETLKECLLRVATRRDIKAFENVFDQINKQPDTGLSHSHELRYQKPLALSVISRNTPYCLLPFIPDGYHSLVWKRISPAILSCELCRDSSGAKVELIRIKAGGGAIAHTHLGDEFTVVLSGSFSDERGLYQTGDFILKSSSHKHTPTATLDEECICLIVTEAPIMLTGFFYRILNPFLKRSYHTEQLKNARY